MTRIQSWLAALLIFGAPAWSQAQQATEAAAHPEAASPPAAVAVVPPPASTRADGSPIGRFSAGRPTLTAEAYDARLLSSTILITVGYGMVLINGAVALGNYIAMRQVKDVRRGRAAARSRLDIDGDGNVDAEDERTFRSATRAFSVLGAIGVCIGTTGSVLLAQLMRDKRLAAQNGRLSSRPLRQPQWRYHADIRHDGASLFVSRRF